jgi:hypothetical protein
MSRKSTESVQSAVSRLGAIRLNMEIPWKQWSISSPSPSPIWDASNPDDMHFLMPLGNRSCDKYSDGMEHVHDLANGPTGVHIVVFKTLRKIPSLKGRMRKFSTCHKAQKLLRHISRDRGGSPDFNHTKYINYGCEIREKMPIIFP